jgi:molecular chaperone IbpA
MKNSDLAKQYADIQKFFDNHSKWFIGTSPSLTKMLDAQKELVKSVSNSFPFYNIIEKDEEHYVIEMGLAGYDKHEVEITLDEKNNTLRIESNTSADVDSEDEKFKHHSLTKKFFSRTFRLADDVEVESSEMANGLLKVYLAAAADVSKSIKKIDIT